MKTNTDYTVAHCSAGVLVLLIFVLPVLAWAQTGRITGQVIAEESGEVLPRAYVEVLGSNLSEKMNALSDAKGHYVIQDVSPGSYTLKATFIGYLGTTVENVVVTAGEVIVVDIEMVALPFEMDEIVVSASRRAENILDATASISKVDRKEIQDNTMATSISSVVKHV